MKREILFRGKRKDNGESGKIDNYGGDLYDLYLEVRDA